MKIFVVAATVLVALLLTGKAPAKAQLLANAEIQSPAQRARIPIQPNIWSAYITLKSKNHYIGVSGLNGAFNVEINGYEELLDGNSLVATDGVGYAYVAVSSDEIRLFPAGGPGAASLQYTRGFGTGSYDTTATAQCHDCSGYENSALAATTHYFTVYNPNEI